MTDTASDNESVNINDLVANDESVEEFDNKTAMKNHCELNDKMLGEYKEIVPKVGMKFKDHNEVFEFYKRYAYCTGFQVRKGKLRKGEDGVLRNVTFTCREGRRIRSSSISLKRKLTTQTGCKARLTACSEVSGIWRINTVHLKHNHALSSSTSRVYRCDQLLAANVRHKPEVDYVAENSLSKSDTVVHVDKGGYGNMVYTVKNEAKRLKLREGDAAAIQAYFSKMQIQCPGFFYSMDFDEELRLRNVFWADNRSREAYKEFADVVSFDTAYLTDKYDIPLVTFLGVNHHGQSILLGCGLISNEDTLTFVWLFKAWLQCMHNQAPSGIITDQGMPIQNAIQGVFPNTKHRWCLFNVLKGLRERLEGHVRTCEIIAAVIRLVHDSRSQEEFEKGWSVMIDSLMLHDNELVSKLYKERDHWVPCFFKTHFWAGISRIKHSEIDNAFLDRYIHSKTSLKQFFEKYERALRSMVEKEFQANFNTSSQIIPCRTKYKMEKQFQDAYTMSKFKEFQEEFIGVMYCQIITTEKGFWGVTHEVQEKIVFEERMRKETYKVLFHWGKCEVGCSCHLFEFKGILCKHAISVLIHNDVISIPEKYILRRWRRDVPRPHTRVKFNYDGWVSSPQQVRYEKLCEEFAELANHAADDEDQTRLIKEWMIDKFTDFIMPNRGAKACATVMNMMLTSDMSRPMVPMCACLVVSKTHLLSV